jgi:hypothetical protein
MIKNKPQRSATKTADREGAENAEGIKVYNNRK